MKVGELREKLSNLPKEEIIKLASEFYKLIPKSKKEDYGLDSMINNPKKKTTKKSISKVVKLSLAEIEKEVDKFIINAREQNYLVPNRVIPKKERSTWRFKVKKWYKELINTKRDDSNLGKQAKVLSNLYEIICESCGYEYFSAYDSFESIGISQADFYKSVLILLNESGGKLELIEKGIPLILDNHLNRYTLYSGLMRVFLEFMDLSDLKYKCISKVEQLIKQTNFVPKPKEQKSWVMFSDGTEYRKESKNNNLAELGYRLYFELGEYEEGIEFYKSNYYSFSEEVKLYVLIRLLFEGQHKKYILKEIEESKKNGVEPRKKLMDLYRELKDKNEFPKYMG